MAQHIDRTELRTQDVGARAQLGEERPLFRTRNRAASASDLGSYSITVARSNRSRAVAVVPRCHIFFATISTAVSTRTSRPAIRHVSNAGVVRFGAATKSISPSGLTSFTWPASST